MVQILAEGPELVGVLRWVRIPEVLGLPPGGIPAEYPVETMEDKFFRPEVIQAGITG